MTNSLKSKIKKSFFTEWPNLGYLWSPTSCIHSLNTLPPPVPYYFSYLLLSLMIRSQIFSIEYVNVYYKSFTVNIKQNQIKIFLFNRPKKRYFQDPGWDSIDDEELYTDEEFQRFESEREQQIKYEHEP